MSFDYPYLDGLRLYAKGRIAPEDAVRQEKTAREILRRLKTQPGLVLADEVGMGKTFVALAVAASVIAAEKNNRPVVVMVPPSLIEKWPQDYSVLKKCLPADVANKIKQASASTAVEFLKFLDDAPETRNNLIFLTHGAMSRGITDDWVKVALIQRALKYRKNIDDVYSALYRFMGDIIYGLKKIQNANPDIWKILLNRDASDWKRIITKYCPGYPLDDNPVPEALRKALEKDDISTNSLFEALKKIPRRDSKHFKASCHAVGQEISAKLRDLWGECVHSLDIHLPLLILDEAHHLKNSDTKVASLFGSNEAAADADEVTKGPLEGVFERMLFLTATPFQLGHYELISVLSRFKGTNWGTFVLPKVEAKNIFEANLNDLEEKLDRAQAASSRLDHAWERLNPDDLRVGEKYYADTEAWWLGIYGKPIEIANSTVKDVLQRYEEAKNEMRQAEITLKPWVIRHTRAINLPGLTPLIPRRTRLPGDAILSADIVDAAQRKGLQISGEALLPFLLAARAVACTPESRPVFSEGLASSYEAFLHTRSQRLEDATKKTSAQAETPTTQVVDVDDFQEEAANVCTGELDWYLDKIKQTLSKTSQTSVISHPKVGATTKRVVDLWRAGEKVLVFCHYIATGRALRQAISSAILNEINILGAKKLGCDPKGVPEQLELIGKRFFDVDSPVRRGVDSKIGALISRHPKLEADRERILSIIRRNLRTPSFLVRFFPIGDKLTEESVQTALEAEDSSGIKSSGMKLEIILDNFLQFLDEHCGFEERNNYLAALDKVQTGTHVGSDVRDTFSKDEISPGVREEILIPNIRLANGQMLPDTRRRLMLTFNTPFFPEVLISSSVLAEGVDLHLNCRHVIHHDLCWNPSTLEQRTGRVDRIGAKAEHCHKSIQIYLPYVAETQDQKMYQVVMDRERWFKIVMGEKLVIDARTAERLSKRLPLPISAAEGLIFKLNLA